MSSNDILVIDNLSKIYHTNNSEITAIKDLNLNIKDGEFVAIVGPSGCGKTTLLSILCGLENKSNGNILFPKGKAKMGYMLQKDHLFEWRTIRRNIMLGLEIQKKRKVAIFKFNEIFTKLYNDITGIENVRMVYEPSWKEIEDGVSKRIPSENEVLQIVQSKRDIDKVMNTTMSGPHRDKIKFVKDGRDFVPIASTGQRRLVALLLRVSQAVFFSQITKEKPILLMDDVMLELDPDKRQKLTSMLPEYDQLFCTFLPGEPYERYRHSTTRVINIKDGGWYE